jgi:seryl-tRNA(Sec) selenium transferase
MAKESLIYDSLGVVPIINAMGTATRVSGSLMPDVVLDAMRRASQAYVHLDELQAAAGRRIAELTRNDAAYICSSATAGLVLATAACITGDDPEAMASLPRPDRIAGLPTRVVIHRCQRFAYDFSVRSVGVEFVEVGPSRAAVDRGETTQIGDLRAAVDGDNVAAVMYLPGATNEAGAVPLPEVISIAHARGVPVIVDAASQIPPIENLWHFSGQGGPALWARAQKAIGVRRDAADDVEGLGADLAIFSGGKGLCGPASTGLILGRRDLIDAVTRQGNPHPLIGRPMKVGKEELCGIVAAVEWSLQRDFHELARRYEDDVRTVIEAVNGIPGVTARRSWPSESGQPMPRARITVGDGARLDRDALLKRLDSGRPRIEVWPYGADGFHVNPQTLQPGEAAMIGDALRRLLA